eukprot:5047271-Heterocapsa_arctica.AAC.1
MDEPNVSEPGNYGRGWQGITGKSTQDPAKSTHALNSELANGCLALVAITGIMFQNGTVGTTGPEIWLSGNTFERAARAGSGRPLGPDGLVHGQRSR